MRQTKVPAVAPVIPILSAVGGRRSVVRTDWEDRIRSAIEARPEPISAQIVVRPFFRQYRVQRYSHPLLCQCDDGMRYIVKGPHVARSLIAEQVVGSLGALIDAPVPPVRLVQLPGELAEQYATEGLLPGIGHGSRFLGELFENETYTGFGQRPENRSRFASLAILFGWTCCNDVQYLFEASRPNLIWHADHGHFLPGGPSWTVDALLKAPAAEPYPAIVRSMKLEPAELKVACSPLRSIGVGHIAAAVAAPVDSWAFPMDERVELAIFLERRRLNLIRQCAA